MYAIKLNDEHFGGFGEFYRKNYELFDVKIESKVNDISYLYFTIYPDHPLYNEADAPKNVFTVLRKDEDEPLFIGRVTECKTGIHNEKSITCESEIAYLLDTVRTDYIWGNEQTSHRTDAYLNELLEYHNDGKGTADGYHSENVGRKFVMGQVSEELLEWAAISVDRFSGTYTTYDIIMKLLVEQYGGVIKFRHEGGINYVDWLSGDDLTSNGQVISFGNNLLDINRTQSYSEMVTAIRPVGDKDDNSQTVAIRGFDASQALTNSDIVQECNPNYTPSSPLQYYTDCIYSKSLVRQYGWIKREVYFEGISSKTETNLKKLVKNAQKYLENSAAVMEIDINAVNLAAVGRSIDDFRAGENVTVNSAVHGFDNQQFLINTAVIDLTNPDSSYVTLGTTGSSISSQVSGTASNSAVGVKIINGSGGGSSFNDDFYPITEAEIDEITGGDEE